jgi:flavin reductase (DIM6/NTAB) family NADH-FMN oxidoreductase RutF
MPATQDPRFGTVSALPADHDGPGVDAQAFKLAMRQLTSPVGVITARHGKVRNGLTATAICSVSVEPPTMVVCVNRNASAETLIAESGAFAVNMLAEEQHGIARLFSTAKLAADLRFSEGKWREMVTGAPVLEGAVASFDCRVEDCVQSGSHNLYIGRVVAVTSIDQDVLLYRDGMFRRVQPVS